MAAAVLWIPLIGSILAGLLSFLQQTKMDDLAKTITCVCVGISAIIALDLAYDVIIGKQVIHGEMLTWIPLGSNQVVSWGLYVDSIAAIMAVVVTIISFMVHIYSVGYMKNDKSIPRFMSYLSLFTFCMLFLIFSDDLLQLFLGWEGVGLSSYLLIGFWFHKDAANNASMKAFITNRIGDMGMILGIVACIAVFDSVSIPHILSKLSVYNYTVFHVSTDYSIKAYNFIAICFLIGAMAKSAQLGLHVWLPDAMEGPTPVSALIHSATMVTAGVFLIVRLSFLFEYVPEVKKIILYIGMFTALFAAVVGLFQTDIKRIIAYSTCSQLGYMFMACGVSMYSAAVFHLVTHAFFKALLFLSAGSVIHAMSGEQNIHKMGGLFRRIPTTYVLTWLGTLALIGIPFFSGYYSKDWILEAIYINAVKEDLVAPYVVGIIVIFLTAFYSGRLIHTVFHGDVKADEWVKAHIHEASLSMLVPKVIVAMVAVFGGMGLVHFFMNSSLLSGIYVNNTLDFKIPWVLHWVPVGAGLIGLTLVLWIYSAYQARLLMLAEKFQHLVRLIQNGFSIDEAYKKVLLRPLKRFAAFLYQGIEKGLIEKYGPNGLAHFVFNLSYRFKYLQTGYVGDYAILVMGGIVFMLGYVVLTIK